MGIVFSLFSLYNEIRIHNYFTVRGTGYESEKQDTECHGAESNYRRSDLETASSVFLSNFIWNILPAAL